MRLDRHLVAHGLADTRTREQALIAAGAVRIDGAPATCAAQTVPDGARVTVATDGPGWVSRGALKLIHALDRFGIDPGGCVALDLGASTGGFTEVLLARGAARVLAVDVGHGQLHPRLRAHPLVSVHEGTDARALPSDLPAFDLITADLAFIALAKALPAALARAEPGARLIALVKPQFEAGRQSVGRGGIVRDPTVHAAVRRDVADFLAAEGWSVTGETESPVTGGDGNREFLVAAVKPAVSPVETQQETAPCPKSASTTS